MKRLTVIGIIALGCILQLSLLAQNQSYSVMPVPRLQWLKNNGQPAAGYKVCSYSAGTSTPLALYSDNAGTPLPNPITLNSAGIAQTAGSVETGVYFGANSYKITLYASGTGNTCNGTDVGSLIRSQDNVYDAALLLGNSFVTKFDDKVCHPAAYTTLANAGAKIAACIAGLPSTGGTIDARGLEGSQTIAQDVFNGTTKKILLLLGAGTFTTSVTQTIRDGQAIIGQGPINRWRSAVTCPSTIAYTGTGAAITIAPTAGTGRDSILFQDVCFSGSGTSGGVDGIRLNGSSGSSAYIEGVFFDRVGVYDFPRYQVYGTDTVFDVHFNQSTFHNSGRSADNIIEYEYLGSGGAASQWYFNQVWIAPYTTGKWGFFAGKTGTLSSNVISDVHFTDSTIATYDNTDSVSNGANGIWINGGGGVKGLHCENVPFNQPRTICLRYTGSNGFAVEGSQISFFGRGIELGNSGIEIGGTARVADEAINVNIPFGNSFNNNACTVAGGAASNCADIYVVQTGIRRGTNISANSNATTNNTYFGTLNGQPRVVQAPAFALTTCTNATPIACTTSGNHGYSTGDAVYISDVGVNTAANAQWQITVTGMTTFTLDGSVGSGAPTANTGIVSLVNNDVHYCDYTATSGGMLRCTGIFYDGADRQIGINKSPVVVLDVLGTANDCIRLSDSSNSNRITSQICSTAGHQGQMLVNDSGETPRLTLDANTNGGIVLFSPYIQANLPAVNNGSVLVCSDCTPNSNPCTGGSTGTIAIRLAGAWVCR